MIPVPTHMTVARVLVAALATAGYAITPSCSRACGAARLDHTRRERARTNENGSPPDRIEQHCERGVQDDVLTPHHPTHQCGEAELARAKLGRDSRQQVRVACHSLEAGGRE